MRTSNVRPITALDGVSGGKPILQSVLDALNEGRISEAVAQFDDHFTFTDHALDLEFTDKGRLIEFFQKSRELFPDTAVAVDSTFQCGDYVVAEWKLTATQTVPYYGSMGLRIPISLRGTSIARVETEELPIGPTTMIKTDLGGSVWLHFSQSGSSTKKMLTNSVLRRRPLIGAL